MKIGLETESYHLQFITGKMDVFGFIRKTAEQNRLEDYYEYC